MTTAPPPPGAASRPRPWLVAATHVPASGTGGGMVRYVVEVVRALGRRPDVEVHLLVAPEAAAALPAVLGVPASRTVTVPGGVLGASLRQRRGIGLDLDRYDVFLGGKHLVPHRSTATAVLVVHDLIPFERPEDFGLAKRLLLPREYAASIADADAIVCASDATRRKLVERFPDVGSKATTVPLAMSSALLDAAPVAVPALAGRPFALVVGDASPRKNLRYLTHLWPAVRARRPDLVLAVAGPAGWGVDDGLDELERLARDGAAVRLGHLGDGELRWAYEHAAVALCPSRLEGFGLPALEAVTFGAPLVVSPDPALGEASGGRARVAALDDPLAWVDAVDAAVAGGRHAADPQPRTWDQVAAETVAAAAAAR